MSDSFQPRGPILPIRCRPIPKIDKIALGNQLFLKHRLKIDTSPFVFKDTKPQDIIDGIETYRKRDVTPVNNSINNSQFAQIPSNKATHNDSSNHDNSDNDQCSPVTRNTSTKSKESAKLPGIKYNSKIISDKNSFKIQNAVGNSFLFNNSDSEKEKTQTIPKRPDVSTTKEGNKCMVIRNKIPPAVKTIDTNNTNIKEKNSSTKNEAKARAVSVERSRGPFLAFTKGNEMMEENKMKNKYLESRMKQDSHKTLTSAFNSNQSLMHDRSLDFDQEFDNPEELIKEVVEKHVEEAYKNIGLIKKNFQKKSKTYMFYIYKDEN